MHLRSLRFTCILPPLTLLAAGAPFALAQAPAPKEEAVSILDRFSVSDSRATPPTISATKLALTLRETPQSITSVDRLTLDLESLFSVNEVLQSVTGVHVSYYDTQRPLYFARGFQITDFQVDGIPTYSGSTNQEYDTALYERVEVIRGANGLLNGAGIPSAVVNLQRKRPGRRLAAQLQATTGSWNYHRGEADLTVPLTTDGRFRSRFVLAAQDRDSYRDRYSDRKLAWLASAEGDLTRTTTVGIGYQRQRNDPTAPIWGTLPRFASDGSLALLPRSMSFAPHWTQWDRDSGTAFVTLDQKLGDRWTFRAALNRTEGDVFSLRVYQTGFPNRQTGAGNYLRAGIGETDDTRDNIDLYASGRIPLFGRDHDLVVGWNSNDYESISHAFASVAAWTYSIPNIYTWTGDAPMPTVARTGARSVAETEQSGIYGSLRFRATDALSVIGGARLSQWETRTLNYNTAGAYTTTTGAYKISDEVTPYLGVVYKLSSVWSAYASYTDIFRPQNYKDKDNNLLSPVLGTNLEGGVKAEFLAGRFQVALGVFETKQDNYAVRDNTQPDNSLPDGSSAYIGVEGTLSRGVELELTGYVRAGWTVSLGYTNTNTRRHALDLTYANVPEHLIQFSTHYQLPGRWHRLTLGTGINYQGEAIGYGITSPSGPVTVEQSGFALVNLFGTYRFTDNVSAALSIRNALDKTYWATLDYPNYGEPRSYQFSLRWRY